MSEAAPPIPRKRNVLLIVSLCLSLLLLPVVAVVIYHAAHRGYEIGSGGVLAPRTIMRTIPDERARIEAIVAAHTPKIRTLRTASLRARRDAFATLSAPNYTPEKLRQSLDAVANADSALERENLAMMLESLAALTPAERATVVARTKARSRFWLWRLFQSRSPRGT